MNKLKKWLSNILLKLDFILLGWAATLYPEETKKDDLSDIFALRGNPLPYATFAEGLASKDYCTRHDAAAKVVGYYVDQKGTPMLNDVIKAAEVLLEIYPTASSGDVSFLVGAWQDQALATTEEDKKVGEDREDSIYARLATKLQTK